MWKKEIFGERSEEARRMKVTPGKCVRLQISADFSTLWLSRIPQDLILGNGGNTPTIYPHRSSRIKENISPLFISLLHSQNNMWRDEKDDRRRERGKHTPLTQFTHSPPLSRPSPPPTCLSARLPLPLSRGQSDLKTSNLSLYHHLFSRRGAARQPLIPGVNVKMWETHWRIPAIRCRLEPLKVSYSSLA